jgi:hypothetical protein
VVTATLAGVYNSVTVVVTPKVLVSISITPVDGTVSAGLPLQLYATGTYSDGTTIDLTSLAMWSTNNQGVATISSTGVLTAVSVGTVQVTAYYEGVQEQVTENVSSAEPVAIQILLQSKYNGKLTTCTQTIMTIQYGEEDVLVAVVSWSDGSQTLETQGSTWTSSDPALVWVVSPGDIQTVYGQTGTASVSAQFDSLTATIEVNVTSTPQG